MKLLRVGKLCARSIQAPHIPYQPITELTWSPSANCRDFSQLCDSLQISPGSNRHLKYRQSNIYYGTAIFSTSSTHATIRLKPTISLSRFIQTPTLPYLDCEITNGWEHDRISYYLKNIQTNHPNRHKKLPFCSSSNISTFELAPHDLYQNDCTTKKKKENLRWNLDSCLMRASILNNLPHSFLHLNFYQNDRTTRKKKENLKFCNEI